MQDSSGRAPQILQFGVFEVDLLHGELRKHGHRIKLQDRPFQLLAALLERPGQVVTREELVRRLWSDTLVDFDNGLNIAAKKVRAALNDDASTPRYVETLPRRGYRFIAPVQFRAPAPEPVAAAEPRPQPARPLPSPTRRLTFGRTAALVVIVFFALRIYWIATTVHPPRLLQVVQLTQAGRAEARDGVVTDGSRIYFTQRYGGRWSLAQVSVEGGTPLPLPVDLPNPDILDISPDRSSLLVSSGASLAPDQPLWIVPTVGGPPRRVGDALGHAGAWSRDGRAIVFARGEALYRVASDGSDCRKLLRLPGIPDSIRWAPPPEKDVLRFSLREPGVQPYGLWEVSPAGSGLRRLLPRWNPGAAPADGDGSGVWAAGGKYFLFRSLRGRVASVWAMRENRTFPRRVEGPPVQLYSTPLQFASLAPGLDGKRVFFAAGQELRELMRYDPAHRQFLPFLPGVSARWAAFSKDQRWIAYVTVPDGILWRSRPDGAARLQLTPPSFEARLPRWSPDGARILFSGTPAGSSTTSSNVYVIPSTGGAPESLTSPPFIDSGATWSPSGDELLFARAVPPRAPGQPGLYLMRWQTRAAFLLPGSESLAQPAWSPDARYIAATNRARTQIFLFDFRTRQWTPLAAGVGLGVPLWSRDSRYLYYQEVLGDAEQPVFRVSIATRARERLMSSQQIPQSNAVGYLLVGLGPGDAPIASVIHANTDIYALELELP